MQVTSPPPRRIAAATGPEAALLVDVRTRAEWTYVGVPDLEGAGHDVAARRVVGASPTGGQRALRRRAACRRPRDRAAGLLPLPLRGALEVGRRGATAAGLGPAYNVLEGFEGPHDARGPPHRRGLEGRRAAVAAGMSMDPHDWHPQTLAVRGGLGAQRFRRDVRGALPDVRASSTSRPSRPRRPSRARSSSSSTPATATRR